MSVPSSVAVGDELPGLAIPVTRQRVVQYSGASTDFNPIHFNDRSARAIGLDGVVAEVGVALAHQDEVRGAGQADDGVIGQHRPFG